MPGVRCCLREQAAVTAGSTGEGDQALKAGNGAWFPATTAIRLECKGPASAKRQGQAGGSRDAPVAAGHIWHRTDQS